MKRLIIPICIVCCLALGIARPALTQEEKVVWIYVTDSRGRPLPNITVSAVEWRKAVSTTNSGVAGVPVPINARINDLVHLIIRSRNYTTATGSPIGIRISGFNRPFEPIPITLVEKSPSVTPQRKRIAQRQAIGPRRANNLPNNNPDLFQKGESALAAQRFQEAFEYFSKAYEIRREAYQRSRNKNTGDQYAEVNRELGIALMMLNKWGEALEKFQEAARVNPNDDESKFLLGICSLLVGDLPKAEQVFREMGSSTKEWYIRGIGNLTVSGIYQVYGKLDDATRLEEGFFQQVSKEGLGENQEIVDLYKNVGAVMLDAMRGTYPLSMITPVANPALIISGKARVAVIEKKNGAYSPALITPIKDLAYALQKVKRYTEAENLLSRSVSIGKRVFGHDHLFVGFSLLKLGELESNREKFKDAETYYAEAVDVFEKSLGKNHYWMDAMHDDLASLYEKEGKYKEAESHRLALKEMYCKPESMDNMKCVVALAQLSEFYSGQDKYTEAIPPLRQALDIAKRMWAAKDAVGTSVILEMLNDLEDLYRNTKNDAEIEALKREKQLITGLGIAPKEAGPKVIWSSKDAATAIRLNGMPCWFTPYSEFTKYPKAKSLLEAAQRAGKYIDSRDPDLIEVHFRLAITYYTENRLAEAAILVRQALDSNESSLQPSRYTTASLISLRASINYTQGKYPEAERDFKQSVTILEVILGQTHQDVAGILFSLSQAQREQHNYAEAERNLIRALDIKESVSKDEPVCDEPDSVTILTELGILYVQMERYLDAEKAFRQALQAVGGYLSNYSNSVYILENYAQYLRRMGRADEAVKLEIRAREIKSKK